MQLFRILLLTLLIGPLPASALFEVGAGLSSSTSGRLVPALTGAINGSDWVLTGSSTGVRTGYYYQANYSAAWMKTWNADKFIWGDLNAGFGAGAFYSTRAFKDEGATAEETSSDFGLGPAFRIQWHILSPVHFNLEVIWGLRDIYRHLTLNGQDLVTFSIGVAI